MIHNSSAVYTPPSLHACRYTCASYCAGKCVTSNKFVSMHQFPGVCVLAGKKAQQYTIFKAKSLVQYRLHYEMKMLWKLWYRQQFQVCLLYSYILEPICCVPIVKSSAHIFSSALCCILLNSRQRLNPRTEIWEFFNRNCFKSAQ
jgi:hypothetical protein